VTEVGGGDPERNSAVDEDDQSVTAGPPKIRTRPILKRGPLLRRLLGDPKREVGPDDSSGTWCAILGEAVQSAYAGGLADAGSNFGFHVGPVSYVFV
jgi:hypothetical protein